MQCGAIYSTDTLIILIVDIIPNYYSNLKVASTDIATDT